MSSQRARRHPAADVLAGAARQLRAIRESPDGNVFYPDQDAAVCDAVEALGFAIADLLQESTVHVGGSRYNAVLIPKFAQPIGAAARDMALAARHAAPGLIDQQDPAAPSQ